jgi:hypothetical protein
VNPGVNPRAMVGRAVYGSDSHRIGTLARVIVGGRTGRAAWLGVDPGPYGKVERIVPLHGVSYRGNRVLVDYDRETVAGAPSVSAVEGMLAGDAESQLRSYYQLDGDYSTWQPDQA